MASATAQDPGYGGVNASDRRYVSGYFGFSYRFPEGWTGHAGSGAVQNVSAQARFISLFTASPNAAGANEVRYIGIQADDVSRSRDIRSAKDFLDLSLRTLAGERGAFEALRQNRATYGGRQFLREDLRSKPAPGSPQFYQTQLVTLARDYAITFSFVAANTDDLEELVRTAESLSFFQPGSVKVPDQIETRVASAAPPSVTPTPQARPVIAASPAEAQFTTIVVKASSSPQRIEPAPSPVTTNAPASLTEAVVVKKTPEPLAPVAVSTPSKPLVERMPATINLPRVPPTQTPRVADISYKSAPVVTAVSASVMSFASAPTPGVSVQPAGKPVVGGLTEPLYGSANIQNPSSSFEQSVARPEPAPATPTSQPVKTNQTVAVANIPIVATKGAASPVMSRIRVSPASFQDYIASKSMVTYPGAAKMQRVEGAVLLDVIVGADGRLRNVMVLSGPMLLRSGAMDAVKQWRFKPYLIDGTAVEAESTISLDYRLNQ